MQSTASIIHQGETNWKPEKKKRIFREFTVAQ